jgi:hypothetical protein
MFRVHKNILVLKNIQSNNKIKYKYNFNNIVLLNDTSKKESLTNIINCININTFPQMQNIYLFTNNFTSNNYKKLFKNFDDSQHLKIYLNNFLSNTYLEEEYHLGICFLNSRDSYQLNKFFLSGQFENISNLPKYSYNKYIQDQIDYYNN